MMTKGSQEGEFDTGTRMQRLEQLSMVPTILCNDVSGFTARDGRKETQVEQRMWNF